MTLEGRISASCRAVTENRASTIDVQRVSLPPQLAEGLDVVE